MAVVYEAEVRNINDPTKAGKCQLRIYNKQNSSNDVKEEDLSWGTPCMPVTSASTARVGILPTGIAVGSRCLVLFTEDDVEQKHPYIIGTTYRTGAPKGE